MWLVLLAVGGVLLLTMKNLRTRVIHILSEFIPLVEGFRSTPYWDVSRWSWGYGTAAPGRTGTITREKAFADMLSYALGDYDQLQKKITRQLTAPQWAALLSFSYNVGLGNAYNIVPEINAGNDSVLEKEWKRYVYSSNEVDSRLIERRQREWLLWNS